MAKRSVISSLLLLVFLIFQAHNSVPHFHIEDHTAQHSHKHGHEHENPHQHDTETETNTDKHNPFQPALHDSDFGKSALRPEQTVGEDWKLQFEAIELTGLFTLLQSPEQLPPKPPLLQDGNLFTGFSCYGLSLRGPPSILS